MTTQLQVRNDTAANWTSANPILLAGEIGFETDTSKAKIGDGSLTWNLLGYIPEVSMIFQNATYTLTSQTAAQKLFNSSTNGTITLPVGTYQFRCLFNLSSMSASSGSFGFALGGTATFTQTWTTNALKTATLSSAAASQTTYNTAANTTIATSSTATNGFAFVNGTINVTVAGTIIPQTSLTVAAAAVVGVGSYFKIEPISVLSGANNIAIGNWS